MTYDKCSIAIDCLSTDCLRTIVHRYNGNLSSISTSINDAGWNSEIGRIIYTCAIIGMFSSIILLVMIGSINASDDAVEIEALLGSMRFREELDIHRRQKRKLQTAKRKVTAWLRTYQPSMMTVDNRINRRVNDNKYFWNSSPQLLSASNRTKLFGRKMTSASMTSSLGHIPEIVVTSNTDEKLSVGIESSSTKAIKSPTLSMIFDFSNEQLEEYKRRQSSILVDDDDTIVGSSSIELIDVNID